ncbi:HigA family addiction module antitoxin [Methylocystis sp. S23]|jgi:addiction module HigA family antidote
MTEVFVTRRGEREPTHPGAILRDDVLPALNVTVTDLAKMLDVGRQQLHRILSGESSISPEMALKLGKLFGNGPEIWINMQVAVDLWRARKALGARLESIKEIQPCA